MINPWNMPICQNIYPIVLQHFRKYIVGHTKETVLLNARKVSTTVGAPSTRTNLKEALNEKIPIYHDLLRNFRRQHGSSIVSHLTVENIYQRLNGVNTMVRETSELDPKYGIKYRGLTIPEVISILPRHGKSPIPEAVFWLLLTGDVPTQEQTSSLIADWAQRRQQRKAWWAGLDGGILGSALHSLPNSTSALAKLSIALIIFNTGNHMREALKRGVMTHSLWEYLYEDGMELLATLPAIVSLVAKSHGIKNLSTEGDWTHFLVECLNSSYPTIDKQKEALKDFLRLYIALNADENGGVPGIHVTEILGATELDLNQVLAAGALAYEDEPKSGTMSQYMEFQSQLQSMLAHTPKEDSLRDFLAMVIAKDKLIGYKDSKFQDPRYVALLNYAKENLHNNSGIKLSRTIAHGLTKIIRGGRGRNVFPDQCSIAAPIFQTYGMRDMKFNQVLLCMSRALGTVASIIWTRAINAPVEHPKSKCTYSYLDSFRSSHKKKKRRKYSKYYQKRNK